MKAKKRYVIGFWIATSLVVALAIAMVAVIAAFNATGTSGFNISYTAINVNAEITAEYKVNSVGSGSYTTIQTSDNANKMTFTSSESGDTTNHAVTKAFKTIDVSMVKDKDFIIHYCIKNTSSTTDSANEQFSVTITDNFKSLAEAHNLTVKYCTTESTTSSDWKANLSDLALSSVADGATINIYVKVSITDSTKPVSDVSNANFSFLLAVA